ncbi:hypothetical protein EON65_31150, partial [archaeon]
MSLERHQLHRQIHALNMQCTHNIQQLEGAWSEIATTTLHTLQACVCTEMRLRQGVEVGVGEGLGMLCEEIEGVRREGVR